MTICQRAAFLSVCLCVLVRAANAQNSAFVETLQKNRVAISVMEGKMGGPGADLLRPALAEAQFVLLGEDHGIQQIPDFGAALCAEVAPHGFHHMVLEIGPNVAPELEKMARSAESMKTARGI
jgi:hypothetical protein